MTLAKGTSEVPCAEEMTEEHDRRACLRSGVSGKVQWVGGMGSDDRQGSSKGKATTARQGSRNPKAPSCGSPSYLVSCESGRGDEAMVVSRVQGYCCTDVSLLTSHGSSYGLFVAKACFVQLIAKEVPHAQNLWRKDKDVVERGAAT